MRKPVFRVSDHVCQNRAVQPLKMPKGLNFWIKEVEGFTVYVAKTKTLMYCPITTQLICAFIFSHAASRFSHDVAQIIHYLASLKMENPPSLFGFPKETPFPFLAHQNIEKLTVYFIFLVAFEPRCEKTGLQGFRPGLTQTRLYSHRRWLEA